MASVFQIYSLGIVAKDKPIDTWDIEVFPVELTPNISGELGTETNENIFIKDASGGDINIARVASMTITAVWLASTEFNRASAPDVCKGEYVMLYRKDGDDDIYWTTFYFEPAKRKKETVMYFYSNKSQLLAEGEEQRDYGYYFLVDTNTKQVTLHTNTTDGEPVGYDLKIDTNNGNILISDTVGNSVAFDSNANKYTITFGDTVAIETQNVRIDLNTLVISNGSDELISLLIELIEANISEMHMGNLGAPTKLEPVSEQKYMDIKSRLEKFKG